MKRYGKGLYIFISIIIVLFGSGCSFFNAPYKQRMLKYYSNEGNYTTLSGEIISINGENAIIEIDISMYHDTFPVNTNNCQFFKLYTNTDIIEKVKEDDFITFTSAAEYFYDGHYLPIVSMEKDGEIYLSFEEGKEEYLEWIELNFS